MLEPQHFSDFHRLYWICEVVGTVSVAAGVCYGIVRWMTAIYEKGKQVIGTIADTKAAVDVIQSNHLAHLEIGISELTRSNVAIEENTKDIRDGIIKLVDRSREV